MNQFPRGPQTLTIRQRGAAPTERMTYTVRAPVEEMLYRSLSREVLRHLPPLWEVPLPGLIRIGQRYGFIHPGVSPKRWSEYHYTHQ